MLHWMRSSFQRHREISCIFPGSKQSLMEDIFASIVFDLINAGYKQQDEYFTQLWMEKIIIHSQMYFRISMIS